MSSGCTYKAPIASVMNDVRNAYRLIELYRSNRCLWDPCCDDYFDETETTKAWQRLACLWGGPNNVDHVKEQINSFLEYFIRERNQLELKKFNGVEEPKPEYMYYYDLKFLDLVNFDPCECLQNSKVQQKKFLKKMPRVKKNFPTSKTKIVESKDSFLFETYSQFAMTQPSNLLCKACCASKNSNSQETRNRDIAANLEKQQNSAISKTGENLICKGCNCKYRKKTSNKTKISEDKKGERTQKDGKTAKNSRFSDKSTNTFKSTKRVKETDTKSEKSIDLIAEELVDERNASKETEVFEFSNNKSTDESVEKTLEEETYHESINKDVVVISQLKIEERLERIEKILCDWLQKEKEGNLEKQNSTIKRITKKSVSKQTSTNTNIKMDNKGAQKKNCLQRKQCVCVGMQTESDLNTALSLKTNSELVLENSWLTEKNEKICKLVRHKRCLQDSNLGIHNSEAVLAQESALNNSPQPNYMEQNDKYYDNGTNITEDSRDSCNYEPLKQINNDNWHSNEKIHNNFTQRMPQPAYNFVQPRPLKQVNWNYVGGVYNEMSKGCRQRPNTYFKPNLPEQISWYSNNNQRVVNNYEDENNDNFMDFSQYIKHLKH